jgi:NADH dehydrogenase FAD-containing subunit
MRVVGHERIYAVGDCVNLDGPKMGHMAVRQAEVAAMNLAAEIDGKEPSSRYQHELRFVIAGLGNDALYLHKDLVRRAGDGQAGPFLELGKTCSEKILGSLAFISSAVRKC